jgi:hypothetical protein
MIKLVTVIGHGANLLPHFIKHYKKYVNEINIVVYETEANPLIGNEISEYIEGEKNVKIVKVVKDRVYDWDKVTQLYNFTKSKFPQDWWVVADIDEFHLYPKDDLQYVINNCEENGWDYVRGGFIDRIGENGEFSELVENTSIWEQFPNAGFFRYPMSQACPNKVCIMKGYIELTAGQHYTKIDGETTWKWRGWNHPLVNKIDTVQVHHFKWDKTAINRIQAVANIKQNYAYSDEYSKMFLELFKSKFKIDITKKEFMFELGLTQPEFNGYKNWNKLINKIMSI